MKRTVTAFFRTPGVASSRCADAHVLEDDEAGVPSRRGPCTHARDGPEGKRMVRGGKGLVDERPNCKRVRLGASEGASQDDHRSLHDTDARTRAQDTARDALALDAELRLSVAPGSVCSCVCHV